MTITIMSAERAPLADKAGAIRATINHPMDARVGRVGFLGLLRRAHSKIYRLTEWSYHMYYRH
jgi:hypothetical protein